jgi:hypothetical protein
MHECQYGNWEASKSRDANYRRDAINRMDTSNCSNTSNQETVATVCNTWDENKKARMLATAGTLETTGRNAKARTSEST